MSTKLLQFECDGCDKDHCVEVHFGSIPDESWPLGWLLIRSRGIGLEEDIEAVYCIDCREAILKAMGYSSYKEYEIVVKASVETNPKPVPKLLFTMANVKSDPDNPN